MEPILAKDFEAALYLQQLADFSKSKAAVEEACNALAWAHCTSGLAQPTSSPFVSATRDWVKRPLAKPEVKKSPVTIEMLEAMVWDVHQSGTLSDLTMATACLLAFA